MAQKRTCVLMCSHVFECFVFPNVSTNLKGWSHRRRKVWGSCEPDKGMDCSSKIWDILPPQGFKCMFQKLKYYSWHAFKCTRLNQAINGQKYDQMIPNVFVITLEILHVHVAKQWRITSSKSNPYRIFTNPFCGLKLQSCREGCSYWTNDLQNTGRSDLKRLGGAVIF